MNQNLLQQYFPMIRTREEVENLIRRNLELHSLFQSWKVEQQQEFLDFCTGERGLKIMYDIFFKEIFNPEYAPERLATLLSLIMKQKVKILQILPNDTTRIADEASLLITDIIVELADYSLANIEIQKIGYMFPGQRCACYSADLLLRQYKRLKSTYHKNFSYRSVKNVYTFIFFERSTKEFHDFPNCYLHYFSQKSDTGLELDLLQKYYFIPLDIFRENIQNKGIKTELDAWLTFLTSDKPEDILELIQAFPKFKAMYEEIYDLCKNIERVMHMFSKELMQMDRNTVQYMIDVMQDEINESKKVITDIGQQLDEQSQQLKEQDQQLKEKKQQLDEQSQKLKEQGQQLERQGRVKQLYTLLTHDGRLEELGRAVTEEAFCEKLLEEYGINES